MIRVQNLKKSYGDTVAVDDLSLDIEPGEAFGLLGPNGAGKSTTMHCLTGVMAADSGAIDIHGQGEPSAATVRKTIGVAPQELALYPELSGEENIAFFGSLYGLSGRKLNERVAWALDFAGLTDRKKEAIEKYSGGMKRRINIACALVHDPDTVVLDEPTVGVDPQSRNHIFESIEALRDLGKTIIYTTHYMEEATRLCNRVAIIDKGKIMALGPVPELIEKSGGTATVSIEFVDTPPNTIELPAPVEDGVMRFESASPMDEVNKLTRHGLQFSSLHIHKPDLESVFLNLTGRRLRD